MSNTIRVTEHHLPQNADAQHSAPSRAATAAVAPDALWQISQNTAAQPAERHGGGGGGGVHVEVGPSKPQPVVAAPSTTSSTRTVAPSSPPRKPSDIPLPDSVSSEASHSSPLNRRLLDMQSIPKPAVRVAVGAPEERVIPNSSNLTNVGSQAEPHVVVDVKPTAAPKPPRLVEPSAIPKSAPPRPPQPPGAVTPKHLDAHSTSKETPTAAHSPTVAVDVHSSEQHPPADQRVAPETATRGVKIHIHTGAAANPSVERAIGERPSEAAPGLAVKQVPGARMAASAPPVITTTVTIPPGGPSTAKAVDPASIPLPPPVASSVSPSASGRSVQFKSTAELISITPATGWTPPDTPKPAVKHIEFVPLRDESPIFSQYPIRSVIPPPTWPPGRHTPARITYWNDLGMAPPPLPPAPVLRPRGAPPPRSWGNHGPSEWGSHGGDRVGYGEWG